MATEVKRRRGTTTQHSTFTGAEGEITVDLTKDTLVVHDGSTQAGFPLLREDFSNAPAEIDVQNSTIEATEFIGDLRGAVRFKAQADVSLAKGDAVYISGIIGNTPTVGLADANDATKMPAFGLAAGAISANATGEIITFGTLSEMDTSSFTVGDVLYISNTGTSGNTLTATAPAGESSQIQNIGKVQRSHASAGSIKVGGAGRSNATPNLNQDKIFLGDSNNRAVSTALSSIGLSSFNNDAGFVTTTGDNTFVTSASFNTGDGVLTLTRNDTNTVTADLDGRYLQLSGGTLTNSLTINVGSPQLILRDSTDDDDQSILFRTNGDVDLYSITGASDVLNIKTLTSRAMKFFTNNTLAMTIDTDGSIDTEQGLDVGGTLKLESVAQDTAATSALVWAYDGSQTVKYRTLGSNAFNSDTIPTNNNQLTNGAGYITQTDGDGRYLQLSGGTVTNSIKLTGGSLIHEHNSNGGYIPHPDGAFYQTTTNSHTGAIKITLPVDADTTQSDMVKFVVDVFDYTTNESFSVQIAGYLYTSTNEWVNCSANILADNTNRDFNVRFGKDIDHKCVWIGETTSTWSYPQVIVRDFYGGFQTDIDDYASGWDISIVTAFDDVDETQSSNFPVARTTQQLQTARTITLGGDLSGSASFDGSSDITISAQVSNNSHTHDDRYLQLTGGTVTGMTIFEDGMRVGTGNHYTDGRASITFAEGDTTSDAMYIEYDGDNLSGDSNGIFIGSNKAGVGDVLKVEYGGKVGIGLTNPSEKLTIEGGAIRIQETGATTDARILLVATNSASTASNSAEIKAVGNSGSGVGGEMALSTRSTSGTLTEHLRIDSSGRLLVNTDTDPTITNNGGVSITPANNARAILRCATTGTTELNLIDLINGNGIVGQLKTSASDVLIDADSNLILETGSTERLRIDSSGNVGIGTTSPSEKLQINSGYIKVVDNAYDEYFLSKTRTDGSQLVGFQSHSLGRLSIHSAGSEAMRIDHTGNVGIGTTSPDSILDIAGTTPTLTINDTQSKSWTQGDELGGISFRTNDISGIGPHEIGFIHMETDTSGSNTQVSGAMVFGSSDYNTSATERMRIDSSGNVGIGTTSPSASFKLDVNGAGRFVNDLYADEDLVVANNLYINTTGYSLSQTNNAIRVTTPSGYVVVGPQNTGFAHITTDRSRFYFNKQITVDTGIVESYNEDLQLRRASSSTDRILIKDNQIDFDLAGSTKLSILSSNGITFNGDTATANALDDYEEGTWTPAFSPQSDIIDSVTYDSVRFGRYTKIGDTVHVWGRIRTDVLTFIDYIDALNINGLPYTPATIGTSGRDTFAGTVGYASAWGGDDPWFITVDSGVDKIKLWYKTSFSGNISRIQTTDAGSGANSNDLIFQITYKV